MEFLTATLDRFEDGKAVLILDDGQKIAVDKKYLIGFRPGEVVNFNFLNDIESKERRIKVLKSILNEVIDQRES